MILTFESYTNVAFIRLYKLYKNHQQTYPALSPEQAMYNKLDNPASTD